MRSSTLDPSAMKRTLLVVAILFAALPYASAQLPPPPLPAAQARFEVASVKVCPSGDPHFSTGGLPANRFHAAYANLRLLIAIAYGMDDQNIAGADQLETPYYDVDAKVEGDAELNIVRMRPLLQRLLADRFHLAVHSETRSISGFALMVAKGGPKLIASKKEGKPFFYILPSELRGHNSDMATLAGMLARPSGHPVIDKTAISGEYDIDLKYSPPTGATDSSLPDLYTAVQEQLGLKLTSQKVPVDILVIDHLDRIPTEN
jgi:uncharacterized protein (TIGR03435 family)